MQYESREKIYKDNLKEITHIKFTMREIDIISCILHNRTNKKIALTLSISNRTVESHIYNIVSKINKNSKDGIITFIEQTGKLSIFRKYYSCLLIEICFEQHIRKIATINPQGIACIINNVQIDPEQQESFNIKLKELQKDLKLANVFLSTNNNNSNTMLTSKLFLNILTNLTKDLNDNDSITFVFDRNSKQPETQEISTISFKSGQDYIFGIFELLTKIITHTEKITLIKEEFKKNYYSITNNYGNKITKQIINIKKPKHKSLFLLSVALSCSIILFIIYKFWQHTQPKIGIQEINLIKNRIEQASEHYNTDQSTAELAKKNNLNLLTLQKDVDYLMMHPEYLYIDDVLQSKFSYLVCMLSSHYRWNKNINTLIDEYLHKSHKACSSYYDKGLEKFHNCISSNMLDKTIKYYENRYKFSVHNPVQIIKFKLEREHYAWEDFILLSYYMARGYFSTNSWEDPEFKYVNRLLDVVISSNAKVHSQYKLIEIFLAKKYKLIVKRNQLENFLKNFEKHLRKQFSVITESKQDLISMINKVNQKPKNKARFQQTVNVVRNILLNNLNELHNININLISLLNDSNNYINHYKPWIGINNSKKEIIIPNKVRFNVATTCGEILLTQVTIMLYNFLLYSDDHKKLHKENQNSLLYSFEIVNKFINYDQMNNYWDDIGIKHTKQKIIQALKILLTMDFGNYNNISSDIIVIYNQMLEEQFNVALKSNVKQVLIKLRNKEGG